MFLDTIHCTQLHGYNPEFGFWNLSYVLLTCCNTFLPSFGANNVMKYWSLTDTWTDWCEGRNSNLNSSILDQCGSRTGCCWRDCWAGSAHTQTYTLQQVKMSVICWLLVWFSVQIINPHSQYCQQRKWFVLLISLDHLGS